MKAAQTKFLVEVRRYFKGTDNTRSPRGGGRGGVLMGRAKPKEQEVRRFIDKL